MESEVSRRVPQSGGSESVKAVAPVLWNLGMVSWREFALQENTIGFKPTIIAAGRHQLSGSTPELTDETFNLDLRNVADQLSMLKQVTFLSYVRLPDSYFVWVYDDRGVFGHRIQTPPARIDSLARNFRQLCSDPSSDLITLNKQSRALYDLLLAPIENHIASNRTLVIEDDGALSNLAFVALRDAQNRYLADRFLITSSLGIFYSLQANSSQPITIDSRALIATVSSPATSTGEGLPALSDVQSEGQKVAQAFKSSQLLDGHSATVDAVRSLVRNSELFHFAGHAIASPGQTGLLLSDGILDYSGLAETNLSQLRLAVLSACDTVGEIEGTESNPESLARLFTIAHVPRIIASRWNIDSVETKEFMDQFYSALMQNGNALEALKSAESIVRKKQNTEHPYYWAAFTEFGVD